MDPGTTATLAQPERTATLRAEEWRTAGCGRAMKASFVRLALLYFACTCASAAETRALHFPGFEGVPVRYGANKMLMRAAINGHAATLIIDTGASHSVLEAKRAAPLEVTPVGPDSPYGEITYLNGQAFKVGYVKNLRAGQMDFGGGPIALFDSNSRNSLLLHSRFGNIDADGIVGSDILTRYRAVINCRTGRIFFNTDPAEHLRLARTATAEHYVKVPVREEANHEFTVPCDINGKTARLLLDTGAFITTFDQNAIKGLGVSLRATGAKGSFSDGVARRISVGKFNRLKIGDFNVAPQQFGAAVLPTFALEHGSAHVDGILGIELLVMTRAIIDLDSMSLFLK
jgi:predicted aspartyl protease